MSTNKLSHRWLVLAAGVCTMLFAGILYAWSILKVPLANELGYSGSVLALSYTFAMSFFCIGGFASNALMRLVGVRWSIIISGLMAGAGFVLSSFLNTAGYMYLYITYSFMSGLGIGMVYIIIIAQVNAWFPDKRGTSSGALMMGFGASSLVLGSIADKLFVSSMGWRNTYILIGCAITLVIVLAAFVVQKPDASVMLPSPKKKDGSNTKTDELRESTPIEMLKSFVFWRVFVAFICMTAVGSSVISFARDLSVSVGAESTLATTFVGVLAICNGLGRIITGAVFDAMGRRFAMVAANVLTVIAAGVILLAVYMTSLPICVIGLCLTGMSYGSVPTNSSAFVSAFYGFKHFSTNLSIMNFSLMFASFVATLSSTLLTATGGYVVPFVMLVSMSVLALILNLSVKKDN